MSNALAAGSLPPQQPPPSPQDAAPAPPAPPAPPAQPDAPQAPPEAAEPAPDAEPDADAPPPTLAEAGIDPEKLQDAIHKMAVMTTKLSTVLEKTTVTRSDVITLMTGIVREEIMSPVTAAGFLADIPEDPQEIKEWVQRHADKGHELLAQMAYTQHGSALEGQDQGPEMPQ